MHFTMKFYTSFAYCNTRYHVFTYHGMEIAWVCDQLMQDPHGRCPVAFVCPYLRDCERISICDVL